MSELLSAPPYALAAIPFAFPALVARAGRAQVGNGREAILACFVVARLAAAVGPPVALSAELLRERAEAARGWLGTQSIEQGLRTRLQRAIAATGTGDAATVAAELEALRVAVGSLLDPASSSELKRLADRIRG